jgi:two-component system invasion response regulator UvrY
MPTTLEPTDTPDFLSPERVGVLTVDDEASFRNVAREVILATPGFEPLAEAASGEEAIALFSVLHPQLVLLDVRMPGLGGIEAARRMLALDGRTAVVLMSADPQALRYGIASAGQVAVLRKEQLRPTTLMALWQRWERDRGG